MAKCAFCGEETELYVMGQPKCMKCDTQHAQSEKGSASDAVLSKESSALLEKARTARLEYERIVKEETSFAISLGRGSEGVQFPDSIPHSKKLAQRRALALQKYELAWEAYLKSLRTS